MTGMLVRRPRTAAVARATPTYVTTNNFSGTSAATSVPLPSGYQAGDLIIVAVHARRSASPDPGITTPTGWTLVRSVVSSAGSIVGVYSKIAVANDPGLSIAFTGSTPISYNLQLVVYRGSGLVVHAVQSAYTAATATTTAMPSITTTVTLCALLGIHAFVGNASSRSVTWSTGLTEISDNTGPINTTYNYLSVAQGTRAAAGAASPSTVTLSATAPNRFAIVLAITQP